MKMKLLFALLLLSFGGISQEIKIVTNDASVAFDYVSEKTKGTLSGVSANVVLNTEILEEWKISGTAKVNSLNTESKMRDKHLKAKDFFNVDEFPEMKFESETIEKDGDKFKATGTLTIKDITKTVVFDVKKDGKKLVCSTAIFAADFEVAVKRKRSKSRVTIDVTIPIN